MKLTDILGRFFGGGAPSGLRNKPGGLAWISIGQSHGAETMHGRVVRTVRADRDGFWKVDPQQSFVATSNFVHWPTGVQASAGQIVGIKAIRDDALNPIGSPGEDARDETLLWLAVPTTKEPA